MLKVSRGTIAAYLTPMIITIALVSGTPILYTLYLSLTNLSLFNDDYTLRGLGNYKNLFFTANSDLLFVLGQTVLYVVICVALFLVVGMLTALALNNRKIKGLAFWRVALLVPWAAPSAITALIWKFLFNYDFGPINQIGRVFFGHNFGVPWVTGPWWAFAAVVIVNVWLTYPFFTVVILGALQSVPAELNEAAAVDGANAWHRFLNVTLPLVRPAITPAAILSAITTFQMFNTVYLITMGGPTPDPSKPGFTEFVMIYMYTRVVGATVANVHYGAIAAFAITVFIILGALTFFAQVARAAEDQKEGGTGMSDQIMKASTSGEAVSAQVQVGRRAVERENVVAITMWRRFLSWSMTGLIYLFLAIMTIFALFPIYYVVQASLAGGQNLYTTDLKLLPANPTIANYIYVLSQLPLLNWIANTFFICAMTTLIGLAFSVSGAYALSRFRLRGREIGLNLLLAIQAFPGLLALTAYYVLLNKLGLLNTLVGLVVIYAGGSLVFGTWNMKGYFDTLPVELEQAALIDGATITQAFLRVTLPLAAPALAASALFMFIGGWNEYALANLVLNSNATGSNLTFVLGLYALQGDFRTPWGYFAAASVVVSVPLIILFLYAQRFFQSGLTIGSVKG